MESPAAPVVPVEQKAERLPQDAGKLVFSFGFEGTRRNNICYIEPSILMHTCGNTIHFLDVRTMTATYLPSVGGLGIGAVAIHPTKKYFAVCEKGINPNIYIYDYPSLVYTKVLKDGTERLFSAAAFKHDGNQLATVGGYPDYWLTVWDWHNETIILRAKAFSQEVFNVSFSKYFSGQLLTSGVGHIRFWNMASTFTGMKLEGFIGKFGQVPLSDIAGYVELSNGKVLSGTEGGGIIVWEGELVKCQLKRKGGLSCHDGMVEITIHDTGVNELITCGSDGYIRFWDFGTWLDAADDGDEKLICEVNPLRELFVDPECKIKGILFEQDHWMIQDEGGALWRVHVPSFELEQILEFHAGAIVSIASSPNSYYIATAGTDGTVSERGYTLLLLKGAPHLQVRLYNFKQQKQIYKRRFSAPCTTMIWMPRTVDPECKTIAVGFKDGVMEVTGLKLSPDGELLATVSTDATIFFFHCLENYRPIGYVCICLGKLSIYYVGL
ncbi:cilia- and flagella-associated protein 44-like [Selaginella moellendorffii]|uniref:cilia- and flagella-associated protein 44-like n=1 Tax=Selaginella moellendorffii TaxID=88036 RepID=UPI000D1CA691|nr:cilia- and flagella-associated protein 44-like [Selaginella moellendorffii]|eukprot:XP_024541799.1 cilia- and flagella-associated protein 44-like [Selaginella moellendorffii]